MTRTLRTLAMTFCANLALLAISSAAVAQTPAAPEKPHLLIATTGSVMSYYPFEIALAKGYFKDEGLDVERSMFAGGSQTMQALLGGSADMVVSAYSNTLTMAARNQHLQAVVLMIRYPGYVLGITKEGQKKYHSLKDLAGMKIGVTAPGSSTNMVLDGIAKRAGVDPHSYSVIGVGAQAAAVAAVREGRLDALIGIDPTITMLVNSGDLKVIEDLRTGEGVQSALGAPSYPEGSVLALTDFVKKNPHTVQAVANAMVRAERFLQTATPAQIADSLPKSYQAGDRATYLQALQNTRQVWLADGRFDPRGVNAVLDVLTSFEPATAAARSRIDVPATYTNQFVDAAKTQAKAP